jgi:hypothetical protein
MLPLVSVREIGDWLSRRTYSIWVTGWLFFIESSTGPHCREPASQHGISILRENDLEIFDSHQATTPIKRAHQAMKIVAK